MPFSGSGPNARSDAKNSEVPTSPAKSTFCTAVEIASVCPLLFLMDILGRFLAAGSGWSLANARYHYDHGEGGTMLAATWYHVAGTSPVHNIVAALERVLLNEPGFSPKLPTLRYHVRR